MSRLPFKADRRSAEVRQGIVGNNDIPNEPVALQTFSERLNALKLRPKPLRSSC
jgi:hypothetical protein